MTKDFVDKDYYLNNLDKLSFYVQKLPVKIEETKSIVKSIKNIFLRIGKSCSLHWNYRFGDKHWYDKAIARDVVQHYLWKAKHHPVVDAKILKICQSLKKDKVTSLEQIQLSVATRAFNPIPDLSEKVLFHIHGDEFGSGSELEGAKLSDLIEYLEKFLVECKEKKSELYHIDDDLLEEIRTAMLLSFSLDDVDQAAERLAQQEGNTKSFFLGKLSHDFFDKAKMKFIQAFTTNKPLLLPGGWVGKPSGHAMYYEIIPQKNGKANFRIYNLGAGTEQHQRAIIKGKVKAAPYTEWRGVDQQKFLSQTFLQFIYETKTITEHEGSPTLYQASDIYQGLQEFLSPESVAGDIQLEKFMTPQRAGICTWRSLLAFLATRMNPEDFKRLTLDIHVL